MSPSQVVLLAYRVWQGYSHTAPNQTPSPAEKKSPPPRGDGLSGRGHQPPQGLGWESACLGGEGGKGQGLYWETLCRQPTRLTLYTHHCSVSNKAGIFKHQFVKQGINHKWLRVYFKQENKWSVHVPECVVTLHKSFFTGLFEHNSPKVSVPICAGKTDYLPNRKPRKYVKLTWNFTHGSSPQTIFLTTRPCKPIMCHANLWLHSRRHPEVTEIHICLTFLKLLAIFFPVVPHVRFTNVYFDTKESQWYLATWLQTQ